jgi:DNA-binding response OmpR family regulator
MSREIIVFSLQQQDQIPHQALLEQCGYQVTVCHRIDQLRYLALQLHPHAVVACQDRDHSLPLQQILREIHPVRLIILSEQQSAAQRIIALQQGVAAYHIAPYSALQVVHDVGRYGYAHQPSADITDDFVVSLHNQQIWYRDSPLPFSMRQFRCMSLLIEARTGVVSRINLTETVWGSDALPTDGAVEAMMYRIRAVLHDHHIPYTITARYGVGYLLQRIDTTVVPVLDPVE